MDMMCGYESPYNGNYPLWIAERLQPAFVELEEEAAGRRQIVRTLKPTNAEVATILRDHCTELFRCIFCVSGENKFCDPGFVGFMLADRFGFYAEFYHWMVENNPNH